MPRTYSDNATMAKVRALYGKRLSAQDYKQLTQVKSVAEVAAYLKSETYYADALAEVREELVHRGQLESLVRRRILDIYTRLLKYSYNDRLFIDMYIMQNEISQILLAIRLLNAGEISRYILALPAYFDKYTSLDLFALARIRSFDDLLDIVRRSPYYAIIKKFRPLTSDIPIDITACEAALLTHLYSTMCGLVEQRYNGDTRADLLDLLYFKIDFHNLSAIYRLKKYYGYPPAKIRQLILPLKSNMNKRTTEAIIESAGPQELLAMLARTQSFKRFPVHAEDDTTRITAQTLRMSWYRAQRRFRFSTRPVVAVMNYMILLEIEVDNIVNIIEGIRYQVPPEDIYSLLAI